LGLSKKRINMNTNSITKLKESFDLIAQTDHDSGIEFWYARELMSGLGYERWENFYNVIKKAIVSCENSGAETQNHFRDVKKMVDIGSGISRPVEDIMLTRYACYLIAQNGDPRKEEIAFAQSYFALQTRKQEIIEERLQLQERLIARQKLTESETELSKNIYERGVDDKGFGRIRSKGDAALFGGNATLEMKNNLGIPENRPLADFLKSL
jgi:DNA-damage-inducible protein D